MTSNTFKIDPRLIVPFLKFKASATASDCLLSATWSAYNKESKINYFKLYLKAMGWELLSFKILNGVGEAK